MVTIKLKNLLNDYLSKNPGKERELADKFLVSLSTLKRWMEGKNLPHELMAKQIIEYLKILTRNNEKNVENDKNCYFVQYRTPHLGIHEPDKDILQVHILPY